MLTKVGREQLIAIGARHRLGNLLEQAAYTVALARSDGDPLVALLPAGYLDELGSVVTALEGARQDRTLSQEEAKEATRMHHGAFADTKVWRRKVNSLAVRATRLGEEMPSGLLQVSRARTSPELGVQLLDMLGMLEKNKDRMPGASAEALLAEGKALAATFTTADADKELLRHSELPASVQKFYEQKGLLYLGLKAVNDAGHELHAGDPASAGRYSMGILHRKGHARPQPAAAPATTELVGAGA